jgi:hypothetical protein
MSKIVISYRRDDAEGHAGRLYDALFRHFGKDEVLRDLDSIPYGVDFEKHLNEEIEKCLALLVVIGPHWIKMKDEEGSRRLDNPKDWVTMEVSAALKRDIPVIPVTVNGAAMPERSELPLAIADLAKRQRCDLSVSHWNAEVENLIEGLDRSIGGLGQKEFSGLDRSIDDGSRKEFPETDLLEASSARSASPPWRGIGIAFLSILMVATGVVGAYFFMREDPQLTGETQAAEIAPIGGRGARLSPVHVTASSTALPGEDGCGEPTQYPAKNVADGNPESAWRTEGDGLGETMQFDFDGDVHIERIGLIPGFSKVDPCDGINRFPQNRVIERVLFTFDDGSSTTATYLPEPRLQWIDLSKSTSHVIIEIMDTSPPGGRDFTAISEVEFFDEAG